MTCDWKCFIKTVPRCLVTNDSIRNMCLVTVEFILKQL